MSGLDLGFMGTLTPRLDDKARIILPAKFRPRLDAGLVLTRGKDRCIEVFPSDVYAERVAQLKVGPDSTKAERDRLRMVTSAAMDQTPDKQGRVTIPATLRAYAGLDRDLAVIGAWDHLEIWDAATWAAYEVEAGPAFAEDA